MNRNKVFILLGYALLVMSFFGVVAINCPHRPGAIIEGDPVVAYAPAIESEHVSNWHSALFLKECILVKKILWALGWELTGIEILEMLWYVAAFIIWCVFVFFCRVAYIQSGRRTLFLFLCAFLTVINWRACFCYLSLDFYFTAVFALAVALIYALVKSRNLAIRWIACLLSFIVAYHLIEFRKNAVVLLPLLVFFEGLLLFPFVNKLRLFVYSIIAAACFWSVSGVLTKQLKNVEQTHPASMMMLSDLCVASSLNGDLTAERKRIESATGYQLNERNVAFNAYSPYDFVHKKYNEKNWERLVDYYMLSWKEKTRAMLDARILQAVQFYLGGYTPGFLINFYEDRYNLEGVMRGSLTLDNFSYVERWTIFARLFVEIVSGIYMCYLFVKYIHRRITKGESYVLGVLLLAFTYALSYLVVTPTPDYRYRLSCLLFSNIAAAIALVELVSCIKCVSLKRIQ